ncbi:hypothetical protein M378DRAFT_337468 [Amanita muscaria Koide BX008]|uniref:Uncharacterized protein n=1 Tax=Amanita muscaria (strain Koide BX008) TaxID=946122 RepID=A0A0C2S650_AMAMK|nr:hypothetical protein M378DRAFT_337468 [Amanita muscaria Koide BX008]
MRLAIIQTLKGWPAMLLVLIALLTTIRTTQPLMETRTSQSMLSLQMVVSSANGNSLMRRIELMCNSDKPLTITGHGSGGSGGADTGEPVVIAGVGGGKRVFWQAGDGSIHTKGWYPDGTPWTGRLLVPGERVRKPTPLAALCWGGESGFKHICFYYVDRWDVLQGMRRSGGSWRVEKFRSARRRVSPQSTLVAKQIGGGEVKVKYTSMRGAKSAASIPKEIIRENIGR